MHGQSDREPRGPEAWDVQIGQRLRDGRQSKGITLAALAEAADINIQQVRDCETGKTRISHRRLFAFAQVLGVTPTWFFSQDEVDLRSSGASVPDPSTASAADLALAQDVARLSPAARHLVVTLVRAFAASPPDDGL